VAAPRRLTLPALLLTRPTHSPSRSFSCCFSTFGTFVHVQPRRQLFAGCFHCYSYRYHCPYLEQPYPTLLLPSKHCRFNYTSDNAVLFRSLPVGHHIAEVTYDGWDYTFAEHKVYLKTRLVARFHSVSPNHFDGVLTISHVVPSLTLRLVQYRLLRKSSILSSFLWSTQTAWFAHTRRPSTGWFTQNLAGTIILDTACTLVVSVT
jgi:hypothetical protein